MGIRGEWHNQREFLEDDPGGGGPWETNEDVVRQQEP